MGGIVIGFIKGWKLALVRKGLLFPSDMNYCSKTDVQCACSYSACAGAQPKKM